MKGARSSSWLPSLMTGASQVFYFAGLKLLVEDDLRAPLSLADIAAQLKGLLEGEPERGTEARTPEKKYVYSSVRLACDETPGEAAACKRGGLPRLLPGNDALSQAGDDAVCDDLIDAGTVGVCLLHLNL